MIILFLIFCYLPFVLSYTLFIPIYFIAIWFLFLPLITTIFFIKFLIIKGCNKNTCKYKLLLTLLFILLPLAFVIFWMAWLINFITTKGCHHDMMLLLTGNLTRILRCRILPILSNSKMNIHYNKLDCKCYCN